MESQGLMYMQMRQYLLELIEKNRNNPGYKLPSENQLAVKFGASRISAKHAFNTLVEDGVIYRQRGRGSFIAGSQAEKPSFSSASGGTEDSIALIVPFVSTIFMSDIIESIQEELGKHGIHFVIFLTDNNQEKEVRYLRLAQEHFKGILLFPGAYARYHEEVLRLVLNHFPLVQIDRYLPGLNLSYVACDHRGATSDAVKYLAALGHRRIGFVGHLREHASSVAKRLQGFDRATQEMDAAYPGYFKLNVDDSLKDFDERVRRYLLDVKPTAIISSCHLHGPAIMQALRDMGKENEVDLMLYDNEFAVVQSFVGYHPYIIDQRPRVIGSTAADLVYRMAYEGAPLSNVNLPAQIIRL